MAKAVDTNEAREQKVTQAVLEKKGIEYNKVVKEASKEAMSKCREKLEERKQERIAKRQKTLAHAEVKTPPIQS